MSQDSGKSQRPFDIQCYRCSKLMGVTSANLEGRASVECSTCGYHVGYPDEIRARMAVYLYEQTAPWPLEIVDELPPPMTLPERFGPAGSLDRRLLLAYKHAAELAASINTFGKASTHRMWAHVNPEGTEHRFGITFNPKPDYFGWGLMVGQFAHQLRALLDSLIWSICTLPEDERGSIEFPIFKDRDRFEGDKDRKLRGVPADAKTFIAGLQPFQAGPENAQSHPLWRIHELDRMDKHRVVLTLAMIGREATFRVPKGHRIVTASVVEDGAVFSTIFPDAPTQKVNVEVNAVFDVGVDIGGTKVALPRLIADGRDEVRRIGEELRKFIPGSKRA